jgi:hypothetical protein
MPIATRTFRVFVSSTFEDLKAERDALQRDVFPRLRKLCEENNARFQAIDLCASSSSTATPDFSSRRTQCVIHSIQTEHHALLSTDCVEQRPWGVRFQGLCASPSSSSQSGVLLLCQAQEYTTAAGDDGLIQSLPAFLIRKPAASLNQLDDLVR